MGIPGGPIVQDSAFTAKGLHSLQGLVQINQQDQKKEKKEWKKGWKSPKSGEIYLHPGPWR